MAPSIAAPPADGLLASLDPEQRSAATLPDGPTLVIAPAGSGKTTTLIARLGVLLARGVVAERIGVVTFNRDAAAELAARIASRLAPHVPGAAAIEVRTLHAMARQVLVDAGRPVRLVPDRLPLLRAALRRALAALPAVADGDDPPPQPPDPAALDTIVSAWKVEGRPLPPGATSAVEAFEDLMRAGGLIDFDDLVVGAVAALEADPQLRRRWQARFSHLCVDEFQDVDAAQLRLVRILAAPEDNLFVVGDDDQSIYGWRLADVRRILGLAAQLPGLRRFDLETNYRCPAVVVDRADRLISRNQERFVKRIRPRADAPGTLTLAADASDDDDRAERVLGTWADDGASRAFLARTNRALHPAAIAALRCGRAFAAPDLVLPVESPIVDELLARLPSWDLEHADDERPLLPTLAAALEHDSWADGRDDEEPSPREIAGSLLAWAAPFDDLASLRAAVAETRERIDRLRRDDAPLVLATAHSTKGLEFDHVAVVDMDDGRFPSGRALAESTDPMRALEEERRLGYVAWTRARRSLTLLYDPDAPSSFLREAFEPDELAPAIGRGATGRGATGRGATGRAPPASGRRGSIGR